MTKLTRRRLGVIMASNLPADTQPLTVLFVDDEPNILKSLKRTMFKTKLNVLLAQNGEEALSLLKKHKVQVVVSDMKMPNMSGAELCEQVAHLYPETFRIILTGYSDFDATIQAVNQGKIHRFLQKPWDNQELKDAISEGLERVKLKSDNTRLQKLTQKQNEQLLEVNNELEIMVAKRTRQIRAALAKIEQRNKSLEKVLFNVISINPSLDGKFGIEVSDLTGLLGRSLHIDKAVVKTAQYASLICEIGLLGLNPEEFSAPFDKMKFEQQSRYHSQTKQAALILAPSEHLIDVADIIENQFECINGSGLFGKEGPDIPIGAKLLAVSRDYWRYVSGRITGKKIPPQDAKARMKKHRGTKYDGAVIDALLTMEEVSLPTHMDNVFKTKDLTPGMILSFNLYNEKHILLLPEDHVFNDVTIARLKQYEKDHQVQLKLSIKTTDQSDDTRVQE